MTGRALADLLEDLAVGLLCLQQRFPSRRSSGCRVRTTQRNRSKLTVGDAQLRDPPPHGPAPAQPSPRELPAAMRLCPAPATPASPWPAGSLTSEGSAGSLSGALDAGEVGVDVPLVGEESGSSRW